jgi:hypothetical protein
MCSSPCLSSYGRDEQEKRGGGGFARRACIAGNYKPKRVLVELGVSAREGQKEREQRRLGSSGLSRPCPRVRAATREGEHISLPPSMG